MYQDINPYTGQDTTIYTASDLGITDQIYGDDDTNYFRQGLETGFIVGLLTSLFGRK